jgi:hypothetical protein
VVLHAHMLAYNTCTRATDFDSFVSPRIFWYPIVRNHIRTLLQAQHKVWVSAQHVLQVEAWKQGAGIPHRILEAFH